MSTYVNSRGEVVELKIYCGEIWGSPGVPAPFDGEKAEGKADTVLAEIRARADALGYEVRAGRYGEVEI